MDDQPTRWAVMEQLDRIERDPLLAGSDKLKRFLRFLVEETIEGRASALKETVIGNAVYGREPPYDPRIDSTVRVEARRLRRKLISYYAGPGRVDPVVITMPTGSYVPAFELAPKDHHANASVDSAMLGGNIFREGGGATLAIMPIRAVSDRAEDHEFAEALTDEVAYAMDSSSGFRIVSRLTSSHYEARSPSVAHITSDIPVDGVLQGTVLRQGPILRVTIEMADSQGFVLWSDRFVGQADDPALLQSRIAATLLNRARLDHSPMRANRESPTRAAIEANGLIYRARTLLDKQTPRSIHDALRLFKRVADAAPDYARGFSGIVDATCDMYRLGLIDVATARRETGQAVRRALEIDPESIEALTALGTIAAWIDRDWDKAESSFRSALALGDAARTYRVYGILLAYLDRRPEAEHMFRQAREVEPISAQQDIFEAVWRYQRCSPLSDWVDITDGTEGFEALAYRALALAVEGDSEQTRQLLPRLESFAPSYPNMVHIAAELKALLGERGEAESVALTTATTASHFARAALHAALKDTRSALHEIERSVAAAEFPSLWLKHDRRFIGLRGMEAFDELAQVIGD